MTSLNGISKRNLATTVQRLALHSFVYHSIGSAVISYHIFSLMVRSGKKRLAGLNFFLAAAVLFNSAYVSEATRGAVVVIDLIVGALLWKLGRTTPGGRNLYWGREVCLGVITQLYFLTTIRFPAINFTPWGIVIRLWILDQDFNLLPKLYPVVCFVNDLIESSFAPPPVFTNTTDLVLWNVRRDVGNPMLTLEELMASFWALPQYWFVIPLNWATFKIMVMNFVQFVIDTTFFFLYVLCNYSKDVA